jgi:hypothetical protein
MAKQKEWKIWLFKFQHVHMLYNIPAVPVKILTVKSYAFTPSVANMVMAYDQDAVSC